MERRNFLKKAGLAVGALACVGIGNVLANDKKHERIVEVVYHHEGVIQKDGNYATLRVVGNEWKTSQIPVIDYTPEIEDNFFKSMDSDQHSEYFKYVYIIHFVDFDKKPTGKACIFAGPTQYYAIQM